ncbi:MerR family transcriptional regulator [Bacillus sp. MMSF_3328]|uniref:MerR family transcriptional regulator n=1 Tax=Bacillus sp. MMSF_3328 TaxID=3047080 RepID=UPI00273E8E0B|nr:MerR family transcriptional regulator [Bacillus sp. MMSF_3328]
MYSFRQVSLMLNVHPNELRGWTKRLRQTGCIIPYVKKKSDKLAFADKDIEMLKEFKLLRKKGYTVSGVVFKLTGKFPEQPVKAIIMRSQGVIVKGVGGFGYDDNPEICNSCNKKIRNVYGRPVCGC